MPRTRMYNTIRTDDLEGKIAHYRALKNYEAAAAVEGIAKGIGAPIDWEKVEAETERRRGLEVYQR